MSGYQILVLVVGGLTITGCSSDPRAPVNQSFPIRQLDSFFDSMSRPSSAPADYRQRPGYAPAYPPY
jgi:hypothetical protein